APRRCRAGGGSLGGKDPTGRVVGIMGGLLAKPRFEFRRLAGHLISLRGPTGIPSAVGSLIFASPRYFSSGPNHSLTLQSPFAVANTPPSGEKATVETPTGGRSVDFGSPVA